MCHINETISFSVFTLMIFQSKFKSPKKNFRISTFKWTIDESRNLLKDTVSQNALARVSFARNVLFVSIFDNLFDRV